MKLNIQKLRGHWKEGYALDFHTLSSHALKDADGNDILDNHGRVKWDTKYTPIGEELYKLKYWKEKSHVKALAVCAAEFVNDYKDKWQLDVIIPVPPSDINRDFQPVYELAKVMGLCCNLPVDFTILSKLKATSQLKEIEEPERRKEILKGVFDIADGILDGVNVLLFDDLYRSGETLNAVCDVVMNKGMAANVYALTITKTRTKR